MRPHERIDTDRLLLRKPSQDDAEAIFTCYASDPEVTRYLSWPTHRSIEDTEQFLAFSDAEWERWPAGPYIIFSLADGVLLGSTGLHFRSPTRVETGYVFARGAWGKGFATEATLAMIAVARETGVKELRASCHPEHVRSRRVLEKCAFIVEEKRSLLVFPNLGREPQPTLQFCLIL